MSKIHFDYSPVDGCLHPEDTYGEICVKCGECGRYNQQFTCLNCGKVSKNRPPGDFRNWGRVEFYDGWFNICPKCKPLFPEEDQTLREPWKCKMMNGLRRDFERRKL